MANKKAISSTKKSTHTEPQATKKSTATLGVLDTVKQYMPLIAALTAEFVGTFLLVMSVFAMQGSSPFIAFALIGIILIVSGITTAHLNPAMTIGALVTKKIKPVYAVGYIVVQLLGAVMAYFVLNAFLKAQPTATGAAAPVLFHAASLTTAGSTVIGKELVIFFSELISATILGLGLATALKSKDRVFSSFAYGFALFIAVLVGISATSSFMSEQSTTFTLINPAVAVAANGISWAIWPLSVYIVAPVIGAIIGFLLHDLMKSQVKNN